LNRLKSRYNAPPAAHVNSKVTLQRVLERSKDKDTGEDTDEDRWDEDDAAEVEGYVFDVKSGGLETCNCKKASAERKDTHIELVAAPSKNAKRQRFIVEVTPRVREIMAGKGFMWSTEALTKRIKHQWVRVRGWLLFDAEHWANAQHTNPGGSKIWRATAWEIHPITRLEVKERDRWVSLGGQ